MAFTLEEIEKAIESNNVYIYLGNSKEALKQSANYPIVVNYLTGRTTTLAGLDQDTIYYLRPFLNLLGDIRNLTSNDHLLIGMFTHPGLIGIFKWHLSQLLLNNIFLGQDQETFDAAILLFQSLGLQENDIIKLLLDFNDGDEEKNGLLKIPAVDKYVVTFLKKQKTFPYQLQNHSYYYNGWKYSTLKLISSLRPEWTEQYLFNGIRDIVSNGHDRLFSDKYLIPLLETYFKQHFDFATAEVPEAFGIFFRLYESNPDKYRSAVVKNSKAYLDFLAQQGKNHYENWLAPTPAMEGLKGSNFRYSTLAFYLLFTVSPEEAKEIYLGKKYGFSLLLSDTITIADLFLGEEQFLLLEEFLLKHASTETGRTVTTLLQSKYSPDKFLPLFWKILGAKSGSLKRIVAYTIAKYDVDARQKAIQSLKSKSAEVRQTAAIILSYFPGEDSTNAIGAILESETNDKARDIFLATVASSLPATVSRDYLNKLILSAEHRKKLNSPIEPWLEESLLPPLYLTDGTQASVAYIRFLFYRMSRTTGVQSELEARYLIPLIDKSRSGDFASSLVKLFIEKNGKPELKWLMSIAALVGDETIVDKLRLLINRWIEEARLKMAEYGVAALSLQGSNKALRWVEWYSRKYRSKKASVGKAATAAIENAANELGITSYELGDRIVPDFGFEGLFKSFTVNGDEYRAYINNNFKVVFLDDNNRKINTIPVSADPVIKEEFKAITKEVRDIVKSQSPRLEYYLTIQRLWSYDSWQLLFLQNPVMFTYATRLLWGHYTKEGALTDCFICLEDTSLVDVLQEEISIADGFIGIVHPTMLTSETLEKWKKVYFDLSIEPIFPQLDRPTADLKDIDFERTMIKKFKDQQTKPGSIVSTLERRGWQKGPTIDAGMIELMRLSYDELGIEAILEIDGVFVGYGWSDTEKLGRMYFIQKAGKWFNTPSDDKDERLYKLKDIPIIFLHEALASVQMIQRVDKSS